MVQFLAIILLGFFLGMRHATDADHVIAVSTIVSRQRSVQRAALVGAFWGLGHTLTICLVGAAIILFSVVIPPRLGLSMELSVGVMLILLGVLNLTGILRWMTERFTPAHKPHLLGHAHAGATTHRHEDAEALLSWPDRLFSPWGLCQLVRPFVVGVVHGLAGSAAIALLVLATIRNPFWASAYLLIFGMGTILGMMLITVAMALPLAYSGERARWLHSYLGVTSGLLSLAFGLFLVYQIGFVGGLFTTHPHWTPH